jgi:ZIP family zinc transporter
LSGLLELAVLSTIMGLSIFLSLPIILAKQMQSRTLVLLNAVAIGILVFLLADVFSDVAPDLYPNGTYIAVPTVAVIFGVGLVAAFGLLFIAEQRAGREKDVSPRGLALIVALAIGFQNLTEGLVFGSSWAVGLTGLLSVIFIGFFLQNVTEGFPITAPFLGTPRPSLGLISLFFLIGGLPTVFGGILGYFYNSVNLDVLFDALAIGAILYAILPMLKAAFRPAETREASIARQQLVYLGLLAGFVLGFLVNAI